MDSANDNGSDSDLPDETGPTWFVSPVESQVIRRCVVPTWMRHFRSYNQDGGLKRRRADLQWYHRGGQRTAGGRKTTADPGGRILLSGQYSRSAPGPRRGNSIDCFPTTDNIWWRFSDCWTVRGQEPPLVSSGCSTVRIEKALAEDTHRRECPHDVVGLHTHKGNMWMSSDCVPVWGRGVAPPRCCRRTCSGDVSSCACPACRGTSVWSLAGCSRAGRWDPCRGFFRTRFSLCYTEPASADGYIWVTWPPCTYCCGRGPCWPRKLKNHLRCWFLIMLTLLARTLRVFFAGPSTGAAGAVPRWRIGGKDLGRGADGTPGSGCYHGQLT